MGVVVAAPTILYGFPWLVLYPNSSRILLYNDNEAAFSILTKSFAFFNPSQIHSFFPLTYVLSRVFYLLVPSPVFVEFIAPAAITFALLSIVAITWVRQAKTIMSLHMAFMVTFAIGTLSLFYVGENEYLFMWFRSVGIWSFLVFLTLFSSQSDSYRRTKTIVLSFLFVSMILGDDGIVAMAAIMFLGFQALLNPKNRKQFLQWTLLALVIILGYEGAIGLEGAVYYGNYAVIMRSQFEDFLAGNIGLSAGIGKVELSFAKEVVTLAAQAVLFVVVPIMIFLRSIQNKIRARIFVLPGIFLLGGLAFQEVARHVGGYNSFSYFTYFLYLFLPVTILVIIRSLPRPSILLRHRTRSRNLGLALVTVTVCVVILSTIAINSTPNLLPIGKISNVVDARVELYYLQAGGVYASFYAETPISSQHITDLNTLLVNLVTNSTYVLSSPLPSPSYQPISFSSNDVVYSNGPFVISKQAISSTLIAQIRE